MSLADGILTYEVELDHDADEGTADIGPQNGNDLTLTITENSVEIRDNRRPMLIGEGPTMEAAIADAVSAIDSWPGDRHSPGS